MQQGLGPKRLFEKATATVSEKTFENLVLKHGPQVLRTALRVLHDASLAQDVHQEVFLAIWRRWHRYNGSTNWPAYLYRATVRKALEVAQQRPVRVGPPAVLQGHKCLAGNLRHDPQHVRINDAPPPQVVLEHAFSRWVEVIMILARHHETYDEPPKRLWQPISPPGGKP